MVWYVMYDFRYWSRNKSRWVGLGFKLDYSYYLSIVYVCENQINFIVLHIDSSLDSNVIPFHILNF